VTTHRLTLSIDIPYDAEEEHYATGDPVEMAAIDQANYRDRPSEFLDLLDANRNLINVLPCETTHSGLSPDDFRELSLHKHIADLIATIYLKKTQDLEGAAVIRACGASDANKGITSKYTIIRNDGSDKHKDCDYFVLDITHDKFSKPALYAYASACEKEFPLLAEELREKLEKK
jgi:hypothetical protein